MKAQLEVRRGASGQDEQVVLPLEQGRTKPRDGSEGKKVFRLRQQVASEDLLKEVKLTDGNGNLLAVAEVTPSQKSVSTGRFSFNEMDWTGIVKNSGTGPLDIDIEEADPKKSRSKRPTL